MVCSIFKIILKLDLLSLYLSLKILYKVLSYLSFFGELLLDNSFMLFDLDIIRFVEVLYPF